MPLTRQQALDSLASTDLLGLGMEADALRRTLHPENVISYTRQAALTLNASTTTEQLNRAAADIAALGADSLFLEAEGLSSSAIESHLTTLCRSRRAPWLHGLSASLLLTLAASEHTSTSHLLDRFQQAGLNSLAGNDAEVVGTTCNVADWLTVHREAHTLGMPTTAAVVAGAEHAESRIDWLQQLQRLQTETGGFLALLLLPHRAAPGAPYAHSEEPTAVELLKTLAVARLLADSIPHIETSWPALGGKVLQMAFRFGSDDAGSALTPGADHEEELRRIIREAGFRPAERDAAFRSLALQ